MSMEYILNTVVECIGPQQKYNMSYFIIKIKNRTGYYQAARNPKLVHCLELPTLAIYNRNRSFPDRAIKLSNNPTPE